MRARRNLPTEERISMATFESRVYAIGVEEHPNADRLELAAVGDFRCVVAKGEFQSGDLAAYIPEGAVCPDWVIAELGLEGRLAGSKHNRVKAVEAARRFIAGPRLPGSRGLHPESTGVRGRRRHRAT